MCFSKNNGNNSSQFFFQEENVHFRVYNRKQGRGQGRENKGFTYMEDSEEENETWDYDDNDINIENDFFESFINEKRKLNKERRDAEIEKIENQGFLYKIYGTIVAFIRSFIYISVICLFIYGHLFPKKYYKS